MSHIVDSFVDHWGDAYHSANPASSKCIQLVEKQLSTLLPSDYKYLHSKYGAIAFKFELIETYDVDVDGIPGITDFVGVSNLFQTSHTYARVGMPEDYLPIINDGMGNVICYSHKSLKASNDSLFFWDKDFPEKNISWSNLEDLLSAYL